MNVNKLVYENELVPLLGECTESFTMDMAVANQKSKYTELIYVWRKPVDVRTCVTI